MFTATREDATFSKCQKRSPSVKKALTNLFFLICLCPGILAQEKTRITFVPQWTPQAQFAGFYVAKEKGFYDEEGLDVIIDHIKQNSTESISDRLLDDSAQIVGQQLLQSVIARSDGKPMVNVMQITQVSGLWCVGRGPLKQPEDLDGLKVGKWKAGYSEFCDIMEVNKGIKVEWIPFINGINLMIFGAVDAILCYSYSEYISLMLAVGDIPENHVLKFSEHGYDCPEDGLYVTEEYYRNNRDKVDAFVRASRKGWLYARENREEALDITQKYLDEGKVASNKVMQRMMLDEYLNLQVNPRTGAVDFLPVSEKVFKDVNGALLETGYITHTVEYNEFVK